MSQEQKVKEYEEVFLILKNSELYRLAKQVLFRIDASLEIDMDHRGYALKRIEVIKSPDNHHKLVKLAISFRIDQKEFECNVVIVEQDYEIEKFSDNDYREFVFYDMIIKIKEEIKKFDNK